MRVLLASVGSRGDIEPFIALGAALVQAGHAAQLCASPRFSALARAHGVDHAPMDDGFLQLLDSLEGRQALAHSAGFWGQLRTMARLKAQVAPLQLQMQRDLAAAAQAFVPDVIVHHLKLVGAPDVAARHGALAALLMLVPAVQATHAFGCPVLPVLFQRPALRRAGYALVNRLSTRFGQATVRAWRAENGLPPRPPRAPSQGLLTGPGGRPLLLHANSPRLLPRPDDWPAHALVTGALPLGQPPGQPVWQPDEALARFLGAGPPPVYVGFGSMAGPDPQAKTAQVVHALARAGQRGVLATGWGGLAQGDRPAHVHLIEQAPHPALFPHMAAVVHHGGAGTTQAGLRAGRPTLICPFFGDQPFWGRHVHALGLGPAPIAQRHLTVDGLAAALHLLMTSPGMARAARAMGAHMQTEDGAACAVAALQAAEKAHCAGVERVMTGAVPSA